MLQKRKNTTQTKNDFFHTLASLQRSILLPDGPTFTQRVPERDLYEKAPYKLQRSKSISEHIITIALFVLSKTTRHDRLA